MTVSVRSPPIVIVSSSLTVSLRLPPMSVVSWRSTLRVRSFWTVCTSSCFTSVFMSRSACMRSSSAPAASSNMTSL